MPMKKDMPDAPTRVIDGVMHYRNTFAPNCGNEWLTASMMFMGFKYGMANLDIPPNVWAAVEEHARGNHESCCRVTDERPGGGAGPGGAPGGSGKSGVRIVQEQDRGGSSGGAPAASPWGTLLAGDPRRKGGEAGGAPAGTAAGADAGNAAREGDDRCG